MKIISLSPCLIGLGLVLLLASTLVRATAPSYVYQDLGVLSTESSDATAYSYATGINDAGTIVGTTKSAATSYDTAFIYSNGTMTDLGAQLAGNQFQYSNAYAINTSGDIVGDLYQSSASTTQAFLYASGHLTNLGALSAHAGSVAYGLNNSDQVVGSSLDGSGNTHAIVYTGGTMHDLGFLETGANAFSNALGINNSGVAVGDSEKNTTVFGGDIPHGFYTTSYTTNTGLYDMGFETVTSNISINYYKEIAYGIDDSGTIVGGTCPVCPGEAFTYKNGTYTYLGVLSGEDSSYATAKNNSGTIVGASFVWSGSSGYSNQTYIPGATKFGTDRRAFVYQNGQMYDLNAISTGIPSGWTLVEADAINSSGLIVGYAIHGTIEQEATANQAATVAHAFLLTPTDSFGGAFAGTNLKLSPWFGYYTFASYPLIYQYSLGYEYVFPAGSGVYLYDYTSGHFWYTQSNYFPFIYDFSLNCYLYYYPGNGHPRYFYKFSASNAGVISE